ncbi:hypothetical protein ACKKBG_A28775 [Auxenochlorella protothecoides x Auxenochlorella symbiontica]|uniref:Major facilitator superfamily (MFS) profile domain-containing protein n=1 Tax=Auxenochlorella protothecoides TaxID=3075 RepID=A0A1D2A9C9_AUXPR
MSDHLPAPADQLLSPFRLLLLLCTLTVVIYFDKGAIASNGVNGAQSTTERPGFGIQGDFDLSIVKDGFLATALVAGITLSAPVSAQWAKSHNHLRLIGMGMVLWAAGAAACSLAPNYACLLAARVLMGVGTGPFIAVSAPLVDDTAPKERKSLWLAALFLCITLGFALGFVVGGVAGLRFGWRAVLAGEAIGMLPFALSLLLAADVPRRAHSAPSRAQAEQRGAWHEAWADLRALLSLPIACLTILGLCLFVGALGTLSFYGPKAARAILEISPEVADIGFGIVTLVAGSVGTVVGGLLLDAIGASLRNALLVCATAVFLGSSIVMAGFAFVSNLPAFFITLTAGNLLLFIIGAPSLGVLLWSCPPQMRPFVLSASEVAQHVLGDVPTPPLMGALQQWKGDWRLTMVASTGLIWVSTFLYVAGVFLVRRAPLQPKTVEGLDGSEGEDEQLAQGLLEVVDARLVGVLPV